MIENSRFAVLDIPYCVWDPELRRTNLEFIKGIDPTYYEYIAATNKGALQSDGAQYAAMAIRIAYCHGLETLFSLLCACAQAPDCIIGWLQKYKLEQLRKLVEAIINFRAPIFCKHNIQSLTLEELSKLINQFNLNDQNKVQQLQESFTTLWRGFAKDFLDDKLIAEYNNIKHGFRVRPGGFSASVGLEDVPGVPPPPEKMSYLRGSEFGSSFFKSEGIENEIDKRNPTHFRLKRHSLNWDPKCLVHGLNLISLSLNNILAFLKLVNGADAESVKLLYPQDESYFEAPWQLSQDILSSEINPTIREEDIVRFSKDEILRVYRQTES